MRHSEAYMIGGISFILGVPLYKNPYYEYEQEDDWYAWRDGWFDAKDEFENT